MALRIVQLGSKRAPGEGLRIGTVRRPPRGVPRARFAAGDWYDVWLPQLAPSAGLVAKAMAARTPAALRAFARSYRREMAAPDTARLIALLAALSHRTALAVGCYCEDASRCHRAILAELLASQGARIESADD